MTYRVQRKRCKGWIAPAGVIDVTRSSRWGNPYIIRQIVVTDQVGKKKKRRTEWWVQGHDSLTDIHKFTTEVEAQFAAVDLFRKWLNDPAQRKHKAHAWLALKGMSLMCWCPLAKFGVNPYPCHADVLLELGRQPTPVA